MKKNSLPAIVIWVLYALVSGCFLFLVSMNLSAAMGKNAETGLIMGALILAVMGGMLLLTGYVKPVKNNIPSGMGRQYKFQQNSDRMRVFSERLPVIVLLVLLALMVWVRAKGSLYDPPWNILSSPDCALAQVDPDGELPEIFHRGRELYLYLMRFCFFLLGNKPETVVILQLILLVLAALSLYFGVKKNAGDTVAVTVLVFLGFGPYMLRETCRPSAFLLVMIFYGLALWCISGIADMKSENKVLAIGFYLITGYLIGFTCYLELAGITLLLFLGGTFFNGRRKKDNYTEPLAASGICLAAAVLTYLLCHGIRARKSGTLVLSVKSQWGLYRPVKFLLPIMRNFAEGYWDMLLMAVLLALGIYSFWLSRRIRIKGVWFFSAMVLYFSLCFGMAKAEAFNAYALLYLFGAGMAGCCIEDVRLGLYRRRYPHMKHGEGGEEFDLQQIEQAGESEVKDLERKEEQRETDREDKDMQSQYIENPLPVPKKRAHKAMDYDYEVAEDDDFDIP